MTEPEDFDAPYEEQNERALALSNAMLDYERYIAGVSAPIDVGFVAAARLIIESQIDVDWPKWIQVQQDRLDEAFGRAFEAAKAQP